MYIDYQPGDEVFLRHTGARGRVEEWIDEESLMIEVDGDLIPVDLEDLQPAGVHPELAEPKQEPIALEPEQPSGAPDTLRVPAGFHLIFCPSGEGFQVFLVNATAHRFMVEFGRYPGKTERGDLSPGDTVEAGFMAMDELNENPVYQFASWRSLDGGSTDRPFRKEIKLKASTFMKKLAAFDPVESDGILYTYFDDLPPENLMKIQVESKVPKKHVAPEFVRVYRGLTPDAVAKASFPSEIDLHAEKLMKDPHKLPASKVLEIQLRKTRSYLDEAIAMGLDRVYLIHGLGTGRLRQEVHNILREYDQVGHFHNGFHPKYGHGATEVEIR